jgi:pimeloyl-ACP methyl ester carboxylesterase
MDGVDGEWRAFREELEALPQRPVPRTHPRNLLFRVKRGLDFFGHARFRGARFFSRINPYPKPFRHVSFRTQDGVQIAGWLAPQPTDAPPSPWGLVIVPGMFSTKDDNAHKARAIRIHKKWRVPVLAFDLRAFGESTGIATAGWKEAYDVRAAAEFMRHTCEVDGVGVLAESLGAAAVLNALNLEEERNDPLLTRGVLCYSAFVDAKDAVAHISTEPVKGDTFHVQDAGFRRLLKLKSDGGYERFDEYLADAARVNGLSGLDELLELATPKQHVGHIRHPVLLVHATNDPVVPVRHARRMERYADEVDHVQTLIVDWGEHTGFQPMDPWWFWEVTARFFSKVNGVRLPNLSGRKPPPA